MIHYLKYLGVGLLTSFYFFSVSFTFLPEAFNTKLMLALVGGCLAVFNLTNTNNLNVPRFIMGAVLFASLFSLVCWYAIDYNYTNDYSYAFYVVSFCVWLFAAYTVCFIMQSVHRRLSFKLLTFYLAAVAVVQCFLAIYIDSSPFFQEIINSYVEQGQAYVMKVERLYGIGASLDNGGVRFSIILIMISSVLVYDRKVRLSNYQMGFLFFSFFFVFVIGSVISRTSSVGGTLGLGILLGGAWIEQYKGKSFHGFYKTLFLTLLVILVLAVYLYNTEITYKEYLRFAFEGFFNWVEVGEWRTASTDKLNKTMWIWPADIKTWIIGAGLFDGWVFGTDIGYCRFINYSGLVGMTIFSLFFIYNGVVLALMYRKYALTFYTFVVLTFLIWIKVSTDIFLIYALFYSMYLLMREKERKGVV